MFALVSFTSRSQRLAILLVMAASACGSTDNVIGSLLGHRTPSGASGAPNSGGTSSSEFAGASGDGQGGSAGGAAPPISESAGAFDPGAEGGAGGAVQVEVLGPPYRAPVAISGDTIVMGPFVLRLQGLVWTLEQKLAAGAPGGAPDPFDELDPSYTTFAWAVGISGDTIALGVPGDNEAAAGGGAVHIYRRVESSWVWQQKLLPTLPDGTPDGIGGPHFGGELALSENTLVVAATEDDDSAGSAYVFRREAGGFVPEAKLSATLPSGAPDGQAHARFGTSVAVSGDRIVVGNGIEPGAAYVFERSGTSWSPRAKLSPPPHDRPADSGEISIFGVALAVAGDTIVVGEPFVGVGPNSVGYAHVFQRAAAGWSLAATLRPPASLPKAGTASFGVSAALSSAGDLILIGADSGEQMADYYSGRGYVFKREATAWTYDSQLRAAIPSVDGQNPFVERVGLYAAISGDQLLLGGDTISYLFSPKNGSWDMRLVMPIYGP